MPRYFFDVFDGRKANIDEYGDEFGDTEDAAAQAEELLVDIVRDVLPNGLSQDFGIAVRNDNGIEVYQAALIFRDAYLNRDQLAGSINPHPPLPILDPVDVTLQVRMTRAVSSQIVERTREATAGLSDALREALETMKLTQATLATLK